MRRLSEVFKVSMKILERRWKKHIIKLKSCSKLFDINGLIDIMKKATRLRYITISFNTMEILIRISLGLYSCLRSIH